MEVYSNIKDYFFNIYGDRDDYSNNFYIRSLKDIDVKTSPPDPIYFEPHKRDFFEIAIISINSKTIHIGDQVLDAKNNCLAIVSPFQTISYDPEMKDNYDDGYIINFRVSLFEIFNQSYDLQNEFPFFKLHTLPIYQLSDDQLNDILAISEEIEREFKEGKIYDLEIIRHLLLLLLYKIKRITKNKDGVIGLDSQSKIMAKFEQKIIENNNSFLSVQEYASLINVSTVYLSECVKKATGRSPRKIIIDYKLLYAKTLLHQRDRSITEVADMLGFNEPSNFNQFFKRGYGLTPTQFRKKEC